MFRSVASRVPAAEIQTFVANAVLAHGNIPATASLAAPLFNRRQISSSTARNVAASPPTKDPLSSAAKHVHHVHEKRNVTVIPGDGVGPEMLYSVQQIFKATDAPINFEEFNISEVAYSRAGNLQDAIESVKKNRVCLKGVLAAGFESASGELENVNTKLRRRLDLFASVVHIQTLEGIKGKHANLDLRIIRETTEGEYSALEHAIVPGVIECLKVVTRKNSLRIAKFAFDYAMKYKRKRVTAVHKANIMKLGDGLFLESCGEVAKLYPKIKFDSMIIDNFCMQIVSQPQQFDICVMPNLYGNIVDNLAAGLVGGAGVVPGESIAHDCIVFEPGARHSYAEAVGKNIANPTAMIRASCNMLRHLNLFYHARIIESSLMQVLKNGKTKTRDLGGYATTTEFTRAVIDNIKF